MNVGVIGVCGFGRRHAEAFETLGCKVAAVADIAAGLDLLASRFAARPYRDYRELLRHPGLDAVSVSLPPRLHPEVVRAAVAAGLAVLCEKPVAFSASEAEALLADLGARSSVAVGFCLRYHPVYRRLRQHLRANTLGRIHTIRARKCWRADAPWRLQAGGGAVFTKDIHYFDLIPWLLEDELEHLCAYGGNRYHGAEVEDSYHLLMRCSGGCVVHLDSAWWTLPTGVDSFEVVGDRARAEIVDDERLRIVGADAYEETPAGDAMILAEVRAFVTWLEAGGPRPPGLAEAARASRYAQQVVDLLRGSEATMAAKPRREGSEA